MKNVKLYYRTFSKEPLIFDQKTGLFIRSHDEEWDKDSPELMDISLGNYCYPGTCNFCYTNSSPQGNHINIKLLEHLLKQIKNKVTQIAFGGGNPNAHPQFINILKMTREKYDIVCNYTSNGHNLTNDIVNASKKYCGAVAISHHGNIELTEQTIDKLRNANIKTNMHYVLSDDSVNFLKLILKTKPKLLEKINAIIILALKQKGRALNFKYNSFNDSYKELFDLIFSGKSVTKIGFDSCSVPQIIPYINEQQKLLIDYCEGGRFSMATTADFKLVPCSFINEGIQFDYDVDVLDVWKNHKLFADFRKQLKNSKDCNGCKYNEFCRKCPLNNSQCLNFT